MEMNHHFYVLKCRDGSLYAGYTNNLHKRVETHNSGKGAKYTKSRRPVELLYYESFPSKQEAMKQEYAFKQLSRLKKINYLSKGGIAVEIAEKL